MLKTLHRLHHLGPHLLDSGRWSNRVIVAVVIAKGLMAAAAAPAFAAAPSVTPTGPFTGQYSEDFNLDFLGAYAPLPVFSDMGSFRTEGGSEAVFVTTESTFSGDTVTARDGAMAGQFAVGDYDFVQPLLQVGGYWENNSHADDAVIEFFDANDASLGTLIASIPVNGQDWVWNGWNFDTPVSRIRVVGNGLANGFIWYDDMELTTVPEPTTLAILAPVGLIAICRRRRTIR